MYLYRIRNNYKHILTGLFLVVLSSQTFAQSKIKVPDTSHFYDSAHHWYDILDEERVINPLPDRPQYKKNEIEKIADNILLFQKSNGGWAKNFDMQAKLTDDQIQKLIDSKSVFNTTFDNGATHSHLTYLAEVYAITGEQKYKVGFLNGMNYVLKAQYENGGWPQCYPDTSGYRKYITYNDNAMVGVMELLFKIVYNYPEYNFIENDLREMISDAYEKGIEVMLDTQILQDGKKTAWCQQHDSITLEPQHARIYEKPSICNYESAELVKFLMRIPNPSDKIINSIESAIEWFRQSEIYGIRVDRVDAEEETFLYHSSDYDRIVVEDSSAPRIWARFYELETHKTIFVGRDGIVKYSMNEIDRDRRTGYGWYTYEPEEILLLYSEWRNKYLPQNENQ